MNSLIVRLVLAAAALSGTAAALAQSVAPPPLPPGSNLVRPEAGLNEDERKRYVRAHHHKGHHKKDMAHDDADSDQNRPGNQPAQAPGQAKKK